MSFAGVSIITGCELWSSAVSAVGYHLLLVEGYSHTKKTPTGMSIESAIFTVGDHRWRIYYYPNGEDSRSASFISLYITLIGGGAAKPVKARFEFSFVDQAEKHDPAHLGATKACSFSNDAPPWGCKKFIRNDTLEQSKNIKEDCFTIRCDIRVTEDGGGGAAGEPNIRQHLSHLLETKMGADVTFKVNGETFAAHRCVLAARFRVFMAELLGPMKEGIIGSVIEIEDMEANVFRALLGFIYTDLLLPQMEMDSREDLEEEEEDEEEEEVAVAWLQDLFVAADRYDFQRLKSTCEERLAEHMGVSSVTSILALAEQHHCRGLKEACMQFLLAQTPASLDSIMESNEWNQMLTPIYPSVLDEFLAKLFSQYVASTLGKISEIEIHRFITDLYKFYH